MKKILVIGGTNKTAINVSESLEKYGNEISLLTYRDIQKTTKKFKNWSYLDLYDSYSIELFLKEQENKKYDQIIFFISDSAKPYAKNLNFNSESLANFYGIFCVNYLILIKNLINNLSNNGSIIYISSSASETGAKNITYSSAKALIENYVLSLNNFLKDEQSAYAILPYTIFDSNFYNSLSEDNPIKLKNSTIVYPKDIADIIVESSIYKNKKVKIGW